MARITRGACRPDVRHRSQLTGQIHRSTESPCVQWLNNPCTDDRIWLGRREAGHAHRSRGLRWGRPQVISQVKSLRVEPQSGEPP